MTEKPPIGPQWDERIVTGEKITKLSSQEDVNRSLEASRLASKRYRLRKGVGRLLGRLEETLLAFSQVERGQLKGEILSILSRKDG